MTAYKVKHMILSSDVDMNQTIKASVLFRLFQELSIAHTEKLGVGREKTLDKGLLWIVTMQKFSFFRWPKYDEEVTLVTFPGKTMHVLFPRYYQVFDSTNHLIIQGCAIWTIINHQTRKVINASEYRIKINGQLHTEIDFPNEIKTIDITNPKFELSIPYSYIDLNGHMNNSEYLSLAFDICNLQDSVCNIHTIEISYLNEIKIHELMKIYYESTNTQMLMLGMKDNEKIFKLYITFK